MIIYGSQMYFKKNKVKSFGICEYCGNYTKQNSYQATKFGHLYFIPLIPMGGRTQVLQECSSCKMGSHIPLKQLDPIVDSLADQFKSWIVAIQEGQTEVMTDGVDEPVNTGVLIGGIVEDLYCLKEIESIDSITQILDANNLGYEKSFVLGRWYDIQGQTEKAKFEFQAAHRMRPNESAPLYNIGMAEVKLGNAAGAEEAFAKYLEIVPDDISIFIELAGLYESQKNFEGIVKSYDRIYDLNPDVIPDKGMKKVYKKACKKSGLQGRYLKQM